MKEFTTQPLNSKIRPFPRSRPNTQAYHLGKQNNLGADSLIRNLPPLELKRIELLPLALLLFSNPRHTPVTDSCHSVKLESQES